jgi:hypothetical protein
MQDIQGPLGSRVGVTAAPVALVCQAIQGSGSLLSVPSRLKPISVQRTKNDHITIFEEMTEAFLSTIQAIHLLNMTKAFEGA